MELEGNISDLEARTEAFFGREVPIDELGGVLDNATQLWLRQARLDGAPVVRRGFIEDFPADLLERVERVIRTLEWAFDGGSKNEDEQELIERGTVRIHEWDEKEE